MGDVSIAGARPLGAFTRRPLLACTAVFALTIGIRAALLPILHVPMPAVPDEFSYLLAGDTYASGRLANPPHPLWNHFETLHVIQQPTYASKYPPLQGLVLAFGEKFFDQPWIGVWLSAGVMCAAVCWMLQGWMTPGLAFLGATLFALRVGILSYWMNSYWGGAVPAIGGALLFGAAGRMIFRGEAKFAPVWAAGVAILLNSRPYDGVALGALTTAVILWKAPGTLMPKCFLSSAAVLIPVALFMLYFNARVTGNPLELPYQLHERQYAVAGNFLWSRDRAEPVYHNAVLREFWAKVNLEQAKEMRGRPASMYLIKLASMYGFFFCFYPLFIPTLIWPYPFRTAQERLGALMLGGGLLALVPVVGFQYHYVAAASPLLYLRLMHSIDRLRAWRPNSKQIGLALAVLLVALIPLRFGVDVWKLVTDGAYAPPMAQPHWTVAHYLESLPGRQLVFVRYSASHDVNQEWVYNRANIDAARVVWAREMSPAENRALIGYFRNRKVWLVEPDHSPPRLEPYSNATALQDMARRSE